MGILLILEKPVSHCEKNWRNIHNNFYEITHFGGKCFSCNVYAAQ